MKRRETVDLNQDAIRILENNQLLHVYKRLVSRGRKFVNKAIRINQTGEPFTFMDFREISKNSFKQYVFQLRHYGLVETIRKTVYAYYRVRGFRLNDYWEKITMKPMGVSIRYNKGIDANENDSNNKHDEIYSYLQDYLSDLEFPALHNIRLHFYHDYLYEHIKSDYKVTSYHISYNDINKSFTISPHLDWGKNIDSKVVVTPTRLVQVIIRNTLKPLALDENGIYELIAKLGEIKNYLDNYSRDIPNVLDWLFVRADFGMDCKKPLNRLFPTMEFRDMAGALVRLYAKSWPDGNRRLRLEKVIAPNKTIKDTLEAVVNTKLQIYEEI